MIGKTISHYKILEKIGEGGMGIVYRAEDMRLRRTVALKFLTAQALGSEEEKARFIQEAQAAAALSHANVCHVYEIDESEGQTFIAMECVEGQSLRDKIGSGPLKLDEAIGIAIEVAGGLQKAHEKDIVHRDIKSANIMVTPEGQAKVMDFGLAKVSGRTKLTKTQTSMGTLAYMSPEQARGETVDGRTDIWSLGVVLYEMVAGQLPFKSEYEHAVTYSILNEDPEPITALRTGVPIELERIIAKALEKKPARRYQRAEDLLVDLKNLREETVTGSVSARSSGWRRSKLLAPALGLLVVAVGLLVGIKIQVGRQPPAEAAENALAVMYFENLVDPEDTGRLGEMITNLLIADLSESRHVRVVSSQRLYDVMKLLGEEGRKAIDRDVASRVAQKTNATWMVQGSILQLDPQLRVMAQVVEVATGDAIASQRITAEEGEDIFAVADKLSTEIQEDLSLEDIAKSEEQLSIAGVTTHSVEAYRHYLEGIEYSDKFYWEQARESFEKALEADSTFAMACYRLAYFRSNEEAKKLNARALGYADNASELERLHIRVQEAMLAEERDKRLELLQRIVELYPEEKDAHVELGTIYYGELEQLEDALRHYERVIEIDPLHKVAYNQLAYVYDEMGNFEKSIWAINQYIALAPDEPNPYDTKGELYARNGMLEEAIKAFEKALEIEPDFRLSLGNLGSMSLFNRDYARADSVFQNYSCHTEKSCRSAGRFGLASIPAHQGKLKASLKTLDDAIAADSLAGDVTGWTAIKHASKSFIHMEQGNMKLALEEAKACVELSKRLYPGGVVNRRNVYVRALAASGMIAEAEDLAEALKNDIEEKDESLMSSYWLAAAYIERTKGETEAALAHLQSVAGESRFPPFAIRYQIAEALMELGRLGEAVAELEEALSTYDASRLMATIWSVKAHYLLGTAYERSGWTAKAIEQYDKFLEIWKDADPGIPEVEDAKRRLERLRNAS